MAPAWLTGVGLALHVDAGAEEAPCDLPRSVRQLVGQLHKLLHTRETTRPASQHSPLG